MKKYTIFQINYPLTRHVLNPKAVNLGQRKAIHQDTIKAGQLVASSIFE